MPELVEGTTEEFSTSTGSVTHYSLQKIKNETKIFKPSYQSFLPIGVFRLWQYSNA